MLPIHNGVRERLDRVPVGLTVEGRARAALDGEPERGALEALTYAVVDREH